MNTNTENNPGAPPEDNHGRAAFGPGSTTQGGSNYGQGSSDIGSASSSVKQGSEMNRGSNYENEANSLAQSTVGTSNEGAQSEEKGAAHEAPFGTEKGAANATTNAPALEPSKRINLGAEDNLGA